MNQQELAWAAGLMDGESCFMIRRKKKRLFGYTYQPVITTEMGHERTVTRLYTLFGEQGTLSRIDKPRSRPIFRWWVCSAKVEPILNTIIPYLYTKQQEAMLVLAYFKLPSRDHEDLFWECRSLKQQGMEISDAEVYS